MLARQFEELKVSMGVSLCLTKVTKVWVLIGFGGPTSICLIQLIVMDLNGGLILICRQNGHWSIMGTFHIYRKHHSQLYDMSRSTQYGPIWTN